MRNVTPIKLKNVNVENFEMSKTFKGTIRLPKSVTQQNVDLEVESLTANLILSESNTMKTVSEQTTLLNERAVDDDTAFTALVTAGDIVANDKMQYAGLLYHDS